MKIIQQPILIQTTPEELESLCHTLYVGGSRAIKGIVGTSECMERYRSRMSEEVLSTMGAKNYIHTMERRILEHRTYVGMIAEQLKKLDEKTYNKLMDALSEQGLDELRKNIEDEK